MFGFFKRRQEAAHRAEELIRQHGEQALDIAYDQMQAVHANRRVQQFNSRVWRAVAKKLKIPYRTETVSRWLQKP